MLQVSLPVSDFPDLAECRPGDHFTVEVSSNDGKTLEGEIVDIECEDVEEEGEAEAGPGESKPIAIIAISGKPK